MKILIIGGGNMGQTYAQSFVKSQITSTDKLMILEKSEDKAQQLSLADIGEVYGDPKLCVPEADLIILAVKPQDTSVMFQTIRPYIQNQQVILSIMAGIPIQTIEDALGTNKVIRAMPNLPAQIGMGMTVFTSSDDVTRIELVMVQNLINTTGKSIYVDNESAIDASTAISGSGPAYVYYFMKAVMDSALKLGFTPPQAELLVAQTFKGAIDLYKKTNEDCATWIKKVSSKGGTTEAAIKSFTDDVLDKKIAYGIQEAFNRAIALGKGE